MGELNNNINELTAAQEENAAQIAELEEASREYGEKQAEAAAKTQEMTSRVEDITAKMETLQAAYEESYNAAMESIDGQLGLFNELDGSAKTSIDNLIGTLQGQVSYMETYAANIQKAMELGVDEGLIKKLSDGSEESAQILAAIVEGGEEDIFAPARRTAQRLAELARRLGVPPGTARRSVGAGDSMVAGFLAGWLETRDYAAAHRMGAAAGSATAFSDGLALAGDVKALLETF